MDWIINSDVSYVSVVHIFPMAGAIILKPPMRLHHQHHPSDYSSSLQLPTTTKWFLLLNKRRKTRLLTTTHCSPLPTSQLSPTPESCVNFGLELFSKGRVKDALAQFDMALTLNPNPVEVQAALYNKACCHAYRGEGKKAADCLRTALKQYNLKFGTILNDPDLASFRAMPEFKELQQEAIIGGEDIGYSFRRDLKLISEVQAPFRGVRKFFYVAFTAAAGIALLFTLPTLFRAIQGGEGAPKLLETSQNAAINIAGIVVFVALFNWDNKKEEEQIEAITRNETLSRLPLRLSTNRIVELVQLRETSRPVILAGDKETVAAAIKKAERFRSELLRRGVILVPIVWGQRKVLQMERKGFGVSSKAAVSLPSIGEDFDNKAQSVVTKSKIKAEIRFRAEVVSPNEWERWIKDQQKSEGIAPGEDVYIILRLDGRVRKSGRGMPDWQEIVKDLPPMEDFLSKLER